MLLCFLLVAQDCIVNVIIAHCDKKIPSVNIKIQAHCRQQDSIHSNTYLSKPKFLILYRLTQILKIWELLSNIFGDSLLARLGRFWATRASRASATLPTLRLDSQTSSWARLDKQACARNLLSR